MPAWVFNREVGRSRIDEELEAGSVDGAGSVDTVTEGADGIAGETEGRPAGRVHGGSTPACAARLDSLDEIVRGHSKLTQKTSCS